MSLQPSPETVDVWSRFTADPRHSGAFRASDADRELATDVINRAFTEGRLDPTEHAERLDGVLAVKHLSEFVPLISDLAPTRAASTTPVRRVEAPAGLRANAFRGWLGLALLFNAIWVMTSISTGHPLYYWPMWPMFGTAVPLLVTFFFPERNDGRRAAERERRAIERGRRRDR